MITELTTTKMAVTIKNEEEWAELKKICEKNNYRIVKYGEDEFSFPIFCLVTVIGDAGQPLLIPSKRGTTELALDGWKISEFEGARGLLNNEQYKSVKKRKS